MVTQSRAGSTVTARSLSVVGAQLAKELKILQRQLGELKAARPMGLVADRADALMAFARRISRGFEAVTPVERQQIIRLPHLKATVTRAADGVQLGQHAYRIAWSGLIDLTEADEDEPDQSQSMRRNTYVRPNPIPSMSATAKFQPSSESFGNGAKWKFMP
jgi:hypothetical protein